MCIRVRVHPCMHLLLLGDLFAFNVSSGFSIVVDTARSRNRKFFATLGFNIAYKQIRMNYDVITQTYDCNCALFKKFQGSLVKFRNLFSTVN